MNSIGRKVGLALLWFDGIELEIVNYSNYHIHAKVRNGAQGVDGFLTGFYGMPENMKTTESWDLLGRINLEPKASLCVLGDFNKITTQDEKIGGRPRPLNQMEALKRLLK